MLNYRNSSAVFLVLSLLFFTSGLYLSHILLIMYGILVMLYLLTILSGVVKIQMNFFLKAVNHGNRQEAKVAITFDDGPDEQTTPPLLDLLKKHQITACFFCIGSKAEKNPILLKSIFDEGHMIGNHTWSHGFLFDLYLPKKMIEEIKKTDEVLSKITGSEIRLFRPPYGVTNPFLARALRYTGHQVVGWSLRSFDTVASKDKILKKIESKVKNGDIILLHSTHKQTIEIMEELIGIIKRKKLQVVGLDKLIEPTP
jgi:peptidoglycan/xylan/chitin deacetylase (PgdA/CDA1 family)